MKYTSLIGEMSIMYEKSFFYGGKEGYPMSDDEAQKRVDKAKKQIEQYEDRLSVLYGA